MRFVLGAMSCGHYVWAFHPRYFDTPDEWPCMDCDDTTFGGELDELLHILELM